MLYFHKCTCLHMVQKQLATATRLVRISSEGRGEDRQDMMIPLDCVVKKRTTLPSIYYDLIAHS
jgi:hypothetical protein